MCTLSEGPPETVLVPHKDGGVEETITTSWVVGLLLEGLLVAAGHGGAVRRG